VKNKKKLCAKSVLCGFSKHSIVEDENGTTMESKYKERAWDLLIETCNTENNEVHDDVERVLIAMCQLAEEVEKVYRDPLMFGEEGSIQKVYSKAYVEELLQKQRELTSKKIEEAFIEENGDINPLLLAFVCLNEKLKIE
jgi:hypothetical protein